MYVHTFRTLAEVFEKSEPLTFDFKLHKAPANDNFYEVSLKHITFCISAFL